LASVNNTVAPRRSRFVFPCIPAQRAKAPEWVCILFAEPARSASDGRFRPSLALRAGGDEIASKRRTVCVELTAAILPKKEGASIR
jgi:hypothetical protein